MPLLLDVFSMFQDIEKGIRFLGISLFPCDNSAHGQKLPVVLRPLMLRTNLSHHISSVNPQFQTEIEGLRTSEAPPSLSSPKQACNTQRQHLVESFNATSSIIYSMFWCFLSKSYRVVSSRINPSLPQAFIDEMPGHQSSLWRSTWVLDTLLCAQSLLALHVGSCPYMDSHPLLHRRE